MKPNKSSSCNKTLIKVLLFIVLCLFINTSHAAGTSYRGRVHSILEQNDKTYQKLRVEIAGEGLVEVENNSQETGKVITYKEGDRVILQKLTIDNSEKWLITDFQRTPFVVVLTLVFIVFALLIGKKYGAYSLIGMTLSFLVIVNLTLPKITQGWSPILTVVLTSMLIIPITFYLSHGFNKKTHIAIVSTIIVLLISAVLSSIAVHFGHLSGYSTEEAMFLQLANTTINMKGILLAGIIIGFIGAIDDVTVSQASIVLQLKKVNRGLGTLDLFKNAMEVGRDHISSMINTLFLVYTGASLPLLLLFTNNPQPADIIINSEMFATEIIRTLVGSIGLILAVPVTTFFASVVADND